MKPIMKTSGIPLIRSKLDDGRVGLSENIGIPNFLASLGKIMVGPQILGSIFRHAQKERLNHSGFSGRVGQGFSQRPISSMIQKLDKD